MASKNAPRDNNFVTAALFEIDGSSGDVYPGQIDQATGRILVDATGTVSFFTDTFTSTNNQTVFTTTHTPTFTIYLSINGSIQTPSSAYTVSGSTYTLASGIPSGNIVLITYTY